MIDVLGVAASLSRTGIECADLELVRHGTHDVYKSNQAGLLFRVHGRSSSGGAIKDWNALIQRLADQGAEVIRPVELEPIDLGDGYWATVWPLGVPNQNSMKELGACLKTLHRCNDPALPLWDPFPKISKRLASVEAEAIPLTHLERLSREAARLQDSKPSTGSHVTLHGDAHIGNLVSLNNRCQLVDLDDLARGPKEVDLAPATVAQQRFGLSSSARQEFISALELSDLNEEVLDWACSIRELTMLTWLLTLWNKRSDAQVEFERRLASWSGTEAWTPL